MLKTPTKAFFAAGLLLFSSTLPSFSASVEFYNESDFQTAAGVLTLINFESLTPGVGVFNGTEFVDKGLTVEQRNSDPMHIVQIADPAVLNGNINSGKQGLSSSLHPANALENDKSDNFDFIFSHQVSAAGLWIGNVGVGITQVQFLDAFNGVIASTVFEATTAGGGTYFVNGVEHPELFTFGTEGGVVDNRIFYGVTSDVPIVRIRTIEEANEVPVDGIVYDDVQFTEMPLPEPSTWLLLGTGLLGMLAYHRRRA